MRYVTGLLFVVLSVSCTKLPQQNNEITKVELTRIGAWADKGATIIIDSALNYKYFDRNKKQGYVGKINEKLWDTLNYKFESIKFKTAHFLPHLNCEDCIVFELIIHYKKQKRRIMRSGDDPQDSLLTTLLWLNESSKNIKLTPVDSPFKYETRYPNIPHFKVDQVRFPPPLPKK